MRALSTCRVVLLAMVMAAVVARPTEADDDARVYKVRTHRNLVYDSRPEADPDRNRLDVYQPFDAAQGREPVERPEGAKGAPVVMAVHGGAWVVGDKVFNVMLGHTLAEHGIVTVAIDYRLSPKIKHPSHVRDVARAFDWVKKHAADYGGDPDNVFLWGHSAGGHLVSLLATNEKYLREVGRTSDEIAGVISVSGLYRVGGTSLIFKHTFNPSKEDLIDASPEFHVDDRQPPFLLIYGDRDLPLLDIQAIGMERALGAHKSPVRLLKAVDRNHITVILMIGTEDDPLTRAMLDFIRTYSRKRI